MKSNPALNNALRSAAEPYIIQLNNDDYGLTQEMINQHVTAKTRRRKDWQAIKFQFISLKNGVLQLAVASLPDKEKFELTINIEKDKLHVSCSCCQQVEMLCRHAYVLLSHVSYSYIDSGFFKKYRPGGPVELALKHRKHFHIQQTGRGTEVKQNEALGTIYRFSDTDTQDSLINPLKLKGTSIPNAAIKEETTLSFLLMCSSWRTLPFLIPAEAILNKAGNAVKGFAKHIQTDDDPMINNEPVICKNCFRLIKLVQQQPGTIKDAAEQNTSWLEEVFQLWKGIRPLARHQLCFKVVAIGIGGC